MHSPVTADFGQISDNESEKHRRSNMHARVVRGRIPDIMRPFLPETLCRIPKLTFLTSSSKRFLTQIQGRTYASTHDLVERFLHAHAGVEGSRLSPGAQPDNRTRACAAVDDSASVGLLRCIQWLASFVMPEGSQRSTYPGELAQAMSSRSPWAGWALACQILMSAHAHRVANAGSWNDICPLWRDAFRKYWHALHRLEWVATQGWALEDRSLSVVERDQALEDFISLLTDFERILVDQAMADADYFLRFADTYTADQQEVIHAEVLDAYRQQHLVSGFSLSRFQELLGSKLSPNQRQRAGQALFPLRSRHAAFPENRLRSALATRQSGSSPTKILL